MTMGAFSPGAVWVFAAVVLLVVALLLSWGLRLEAQDERERRGLPVRDLGPAWAPRRRRAVAFALALTAVGLGSTWTSHSATHAHARALPAAAPSRTLTRATLVDAVSSHHHAATSRASAPSPSEPVALPGVPPGRVARVRVTVEDRTIEIAPGVRYVAWTFNGHVPGPIIHVRQGQRVEVTFTNHGSMPHSLDFHSARVAADSAFKDVAPGHSLRFSFVAERPGVFLYHCVTAPAVAHIANGMYGAMIVDPARPLPAANSFVLTSGEWYTDGKTPAHLDYQKALAMTPDWTTFNGRAFQYDDAPLHVAPGERVRFYVVNAGPNLVVPFHIVGGIFDRAYVDGDMSHWLRDVQTTDVPPGGAAIFDVHFATRGVYGFVNHSFANAEKGEIGTVLVGSAHGTMSH
jgi:copper-containing nitrite reductase